MTLTQRFEMLSRNCTYPWFLLLSSVPLYEYTTICLSLFLLMGIFIFLVIVNKSCMCLSVDMLSFLWGKYQKWNLLGHKTDASLTLKGTAKEIANTVGPFHSLLAMWERSSCFFIAANIWRCLSFSYFSYSSGCVMASSCSFNFHFSDD